VCVCARACVRVRARIIKNLKLLLVFLIIHHSLRRATWKKFF